MHWSVTIERPKAYHANPALLALVMLGMTACNEVESVREPASPPSIVLIVADTLRADALGYRGLGPNVTPAIDQLASESIRFSNAYAAAPWTKPSVASLLTGVHPTRHGVTNHEGHFWTEGEGEGDAVQRGTGVVPDDLLTLAEGLRDAGYRTAAFVANEWLKRGYGYDQGFDHYEDDIAPDRDGGTFARADRWLAEQAEDTPTFIYIHAMETHGPYDAGPLFVERARKAALGESRALSDAEFASIPEYLRSSAWANTPEARDLREWRARYTAGVIALDHALGIFLDRLHASGRLDQTALVFTSDHGEEFLEHGGFDHGRTLYDELTRVPLLLRLPGVGAREIDSVVSLLSIHPTLLELAQASIVAHDEPASPSLFPRIAGNAPATPPIARASATKWQPGLHALRAGRHKLIVDTRSGAGVLFDLAADPGELHSVAKTEPENAQALAAQLFDQLRSDRQRAVAPQVAPLDAQQIEALATLGYVEP